MPSSAYITFLHIRIDSIKLIETHHKYSQNKPGRKYLRYLTRSAVLMLCAAWERYNEDLLLESISYLSLKITNITNLNKQIKKTISLKVKGDKNDIKPIELADSGWKGVWLTYAQIETDMFNSPKSNNLKKLFKTYLGILDYTSLFRKNSSHEIDDFVKDRGAIAHNGNRAIYITMAKLRKYQDLIMENVIEIDSKMAEELKNMSGLPDFPWVKDYSKKLEYYK